MWLKGIVVLAFLVLPGAVLAQTPSPRPTPESVDTPPRTDPAAAPVSTVCTDDDSVNWLNAQNDILWDSLALVMDKDSLANEKKFESKNTTSPAEVAERRVFLLKTVLIAKKKPQ